LQIVNNDVIEHGIKKEWVDVHLKLTCKNRGRSLARVDEILGRIDVATQAIPGRPPESTLSDVGEFDAIQADSEDSRGISLSGEGRHTEERRIFVYILIKYRDVFNKRRETSLGYVILDAQNIHRQSALPERNTNT